MIVLSLARPSQALAVTAVIALTVAAASKAQTVLPGGPTATTQVLDFRLPNGFTSPETGDQINLELLGDPTGASPVLSRQVNEGTDPPVDPPIPGFTAELLGLSQNADGVILSESSEDNQDWRVRSFSQDSLLINFTRFNQADLESETGRAGAVQWGFDLTALETYLSDNSLQLDALQVNLRNKWDDGSSDNLASNGSRQFDVLLSYTDAGEGITLGDISTTVDENRTGPQDNFNILYAPSRGGNVGDLIGDDRRTAGAPVGDYNDDGTVNSADYTIWRDSLGGSATALANRDPANSGEVSGDDYTSWKNNFGSMGGEPIIEPDTHKVIAQAVENVVVNPDALLGDQFEGANTTIDLLSLYNNGIREFNLVAIAAGFGNGRAFRILGPSTILVDDIGTEDLPNTVGSPFTFGSGIYINTSPLAGASTQAIPEPSTLWLVMAFVGLACFVRR